MRNHCFLRHRVPKNSSCLGYQFCRQWDDIKSNHSGCKFSACNNMPKGHPRHCNGMRINGDNRIAGIISRSALRRWICSANMLVTSATLLHYSLRLLVCCQPETTLCHVLTTSPHQCHQQSKRQVSVITVEPTLSYILPFIFYFLPPSFFLFSIIPRCKFSRPNLAVEFGRLL